MKKLILILAAMQLLIFSIYAQTSSENEEILKRLNQEVAAKVKAGKIDDAIKPAKQAVDLSIKVFGAEHIEAATAYFNLGTLYHLKNKYREASENLGKAAEIYNLKPSENRKSLARTLDKLALALALAGDTKQAGEKYALALATAENAYGKESAEIVPYLKSMANYYAFAGKAEEAREMFVRIYKTADKTFKSEDKNKQLQDIEDEFLCYSVQNSKPGELLERDTKFREAIRSDEDKKTAVASPVKGGIINGKTKYLAKPEYSSNARERRAQGTIPVRVTIDETGNVIEAKAVCGDRDLKTSSEDAAKKSKFNPTILGGQPVRITGILVYTYVY